MPYEKKLLAQSAGGKEIWTYSVGPRQAPKIILMGGIHGDEPEGSAFVEDFLTAVEKIKSELTFTFHIVPRYNPDGLALNQRGNKNGVDLNRNFPALDWSPDFKAHRYFPGHQALSENETRGFVALLVKVKPVVVIHCHTYIPQLNYTGEISKKWATRMARDFHYPITDNIGYATPGSLGQYCHLNLKTACVCIEFPEQVDQASAWNMLGPTLLEIGTGGTTL